MASTPVLDLSMVHHNAVGVMQYQTASGTHWIQLYPRGEVAATQHQAIRTTGLCDVSADDPRALLEILASWRLFWMDVDVVGFMLWVSSW